MSIRSLFGACSEPATRGRGRFAGAGAALRGTRGAGDCGRCAGIGNTRRSPTVSTRVHEALRTPGPLSTPSGSATPRRIATISLHTSPLDQPGTGDAGGLNVYVVEVAKCLAERNIEIEIFTRAVCRDIPPVVEMVPGVLVRNVVAGPFEELDKNALPGQICAFTFELLRTEAAYAPGRYDLLHAHYWLSGQVAAKAKERWGVPLVQSMHTLGKVKNLALAAGDCAEPSARIRGESEVVAAADRLVANTAAEARQLIELYGADDRRVEVASPASTWPCSGPDRARTRDVGSACPRTR